jgi:hypothetical protein
VSKLSKLQPARPTGPVTASADTTGATHEGAPGYTYDPRSALYLFAVSNMVAEDTFYENAQRRDDRYTQLVRQVSLADPDWLLGLIGWLRRDAGMRSASVVAAIEAANWTKGTEYPRRFIAAGLDRADEPGDVLAYWLAKYGRPLPTWLKRALADAAARLYTERAVLKYDGQNQPVRFGDVLEMADPRHLPPSEKRAALWRYILERRRGRTPEPSPLLPVIAARAELQEALALAADTEGIRLALLTPDALRAAGYTWEELPNLTGRPWSAKAWERIIPSMGYLALLRNLRNFDAAGIGSAAVLAVTERLLDPAEIARARVLPMQYLAAYRSVENDRWLPVISDAADTALKNVPDLGGRTGILIDTSGSMNDRLSARGTLKRWDAAAVFGIALALRSGADEVQSFSSQQTYFPVPRGGSLLRLVERFRAEHFHNGGTMTAEAIRAAAARWGRVDRLVVLTDEQAAYDRGRALSHGGVSLALDDATTRHGRSYTFNLAGYERGHAPTSERHALLGGLSDRAFDLMAALEAGNGDWPWTR